MVDMTIRQIQINLITDASNPIIEWFNSIWNRVHVIETDVYHKGGGELIYYIIIEGKKQWIFFRDDKNTKFWCNHDHYWSYFYSNFTTKYTDIQDITKLLVDNALNNSVATPNYLTLNLLSSVDDVLNNIKI